MRYAILAALALVVSFVAPASALDKEVAATTKHPDWDQCFYLGWYRGVHTEQNELPDWMNQCMAGNIPFDRDWALVAQWLPPQSRARKHD